MDHSEPASTIEGRWPYILAICDLASGCQVACRPLFSPPYTPV